MKLLGQTLELSYHRLCDSKTLQPERGPTSFRDMLYETPDKAYALEPSQPVQILLLPTNGASKRRRLKQARRDVRTDVIRAQIMKLLNSVQYFVLTFTPSVFRCAASASATNKSRSCKSRNIPWFDPGEPRVDT